jgi:hypothetical protein
MNEWKEGATFTALIGSIKMRVLHPEDGSAMLPNPSKHRFDIEKTASDKDQRCFPEVRG